MKSPAVVHLPEFVEKMEREGIPAPVIESFKYYYQKAITGETGLISDKGLSPVSKDEVPELGGLGRYADAGGQMMDQAAMIVLNGGLGTSMGLVGPKCLITAKNGKRFLDLILLQAQTSNNTLVLMNSFNTHEATLDAVRHLTAEDRPLMFLQNKFPKIVQNEFSPAIWPQNPVLEWNPPGHGDLYMALNASGMLDVLLQKGIGYAFVCNVDNLGASLDPALLGYFAENRFPFIMEVSDRTPSDKKGGHLAKDSHHRYILRETAQCPAGEMESFTDIRKYGYFNTNNLWINLAGLKDFLAKTPFMKLPMILNAKTLDPRDKTSPKVYQIETAMGAAISLFEGASVVKVPRTRFYPVKTCNELLAIRSDCFILSEEGKLRINPARSSGPIKIDLDPEFFGKFDQLEERFKNGIPSLLNCGSLTVKGDVCFGKDIQITGNVKITNSLPSRVCIEDGTIIDSDLVY